MNLIIKIKSFNNKIKNFKSTNIKYDYTNSQFIIKKFTILNLFIFIFQQYATHLILQMNFLTKFVELIKKNLIIANAIVNNKLNQIKKIRVVYFQFLIYFVD